MMDTLILAVAVLCLGVALSAQIRERQTRRRLNNLRRNCFLTCQDGVRRRYAKASPDVQAEAEQA